MSHDGSNGFQIRLLAKTNPPSVNLKASLKKSKNPKLHRVTED